MYIRLYFDSYTLTYPSFLDASTVLKRICHGFLPSDFLLRESYMLIKWDITSGRVVVKRWKWHYTAMNCLNKMCSHFVIGRRFVVKWPFYDRCTFTTQNVNANGKSFNWTDCFRVCTSSFLLYTSSIVRMILWMQTFHITDKQICKFMKD